MGNICMPPNYKKSWENFLEWRSLKTLPFFKVILEKGFGVIPKMSE
jgi:hypothetical protein